MNIPIIDPSTLSEEQRNAIRVKYQHLKEVSVIIDGSLMFAGDELIFEWLFGSEFFKKGE